MTRGMTSLGREVDALRHRFLLEVLSTCLAATWERRAAMFEAAVPRSNDWHGRATRQELEDRAARVREIAQACRNRAAVADYADDAKLREVIRAELGSES